MQVILTGKDDKIKQLIKELRIRLKRDGITVSEKKQYAKEKKRTKKVND